MTTSPTLKRTLHTLTRNLTAAMAQDHYSKTRGRCPHCAQNTAWAVRLLSGYHRCLQCGRDPLSETAAL
jgi:uncharacterized protein (DUF983 family)